MSELKPKFSVVIATYNRRDYVMEALKSVYQQTYPAHEIIVIIDGSNDNTYPALKNAYPNVIVREQHNLGRPVAGNSGAALATGDWLCFVDDDDLWHKDKLLITAKYIECHPDCQAITNPIWFFGESDKGPTGGFGFKRDFVAKDLEECHRAVEDGDPSKNSVDYLEILGNSFRLLLERNRGVMSATVIRRDMFIRAGGFCPMQAYGDDWTFFVNVARLCEWHTIPTRLGFSRLHESQSTCDLNNGLFTLAGKVNAWYTGRPLKHRTLPKESVYELKKYGSIYRKSVQEYYWGALSRGQFKTASLIRIMGKLLLPRIRDYIYALIPPQITWRFEKYILGMYR